MIRKECKYCGGMFDIAKLVRVNKDSGEMTYTSENCAIKTDHGH